jgi:prophage antirepressor-like protein
MSAVQLFEFENFKIRTIDVDGEGWIVAKDVCECLGIVDGRTSLRSLEEDDRRTMPLTDSLGRIIEDHFKGSEHE